LKTLENILVTGGAGFIGSNFIRYVLAADARARIVNLDALTYAGSLENLPASDRHVFVKGDIGDSALVTKLVAQHSIDTIVHFAAESHVDRSINDSAPFIQTNVVGTHALLEVARANQLRFHHVSTDEVYGSLGPADPPFVEASPYRPNSPYAASKAASDHLVRAYAHTYGLAATITNSSNNYGPYQFPEKLIPLTTANALAGRPLPLYGDGLQVRDWIYVEDHCAAIWQVLQKGVPGETYNVGGNNQPTNQEIVQKICSILDALAPAATPYASLITHVADRPGHDRRYALDITKVTRDIGWRPNHLLPIGLRQAVQWYLDHTAWTAKVLEKPHYGDWLARNYAGREVFQK
jgi:dTDP-glucose 4,6-dehydratase